MSAAEINQPVAVPERVRRAMAMLNRAAEAGDRCPSNLELADALGGSSPSMGANIVALLETMGLIAVERFGCGRVVTILSTGKATQPMSGRAHWSQRGVVRAARRARPEASATDEAKRERTHNYRGPIPEHQRVDRDPCPLCGVRADVGCAHQVRAAA